MNIDYVVEQIEQLVTIHSPSGFCQQVVAYVEQEVARLGYKSSRIEKGALYITIPCQKSDQAIAIASHLDTLGAMVRSINEDGTLRFTSIGSYMMSTVNGDYCQIYCRDGQAYTGTILSKQPSVHVYDKARTYELIEENMLVRIDEEVTSKEEVQQLGIEVGNFIGFDPKFQTTESGFIKSRHLDNKAGAALLLGLLEHGIEHPIKLPCDLQIMFTTYEEVGHGASYIPEGIHTMLAIDMGAIGDDLSCTEKDVSICVKDSSGPYDYDMVNDLLEIAKSEQLSYALDVYPHYGSDASAALRGGSNIRAALIGPGIHASHSLERTHRDALENTLKLMIGWLERQSK